LLAPLALVAAISGLAGCQKAATSGGSVIGGSGLPTSQLDSQIAAAVGDPTTCVLIADAATGKVLYRYGDDFNCTRGLPACDQPGLINAKSALQFASKAGGGRFASCNSLPDGSRQVGWAEAPIASTKRALIYSAVIEGQRALPGHEINARLYDAFQKAGL
jgi:hypothetical protein